MRYVNEIGAPARADWLEERLGATDPCRQLGQLAHLILRRPAAASWLTAPPAAQG